MQGYILHITPVKDEDLIVTILTPHKIYRLYRFYGARHSTINLGYKIDFEIEHNIGYLPKLRRITHIGYQWLFNLNRHQIWQEFIKRLYRHLKDIEEIETFYFALLEEMAKKLNRQEPKRLVIESYLKILEYEGRLDRSFECFVCEESGDLINFIVKYKKVNKINACKEILDILNITYEASETTAETKEEIEARQKAFKEKYNNKFIQKCLKIFIKRFFNNQFKRNCVPDGPKVGTISLSPRGDWRMPSDASSNLWI